MVLRRRNLVGNCALLFPFFAGCDRQGCRSFSLTWVVTPSRLLGRSAMTASSRRVTFAPMTTLPGTIISNCCLFFSCQLPILLHFLTRGHLVGHYAHTFVPNVTPHLTYALWDHPAVSKTIGSGVRMMRPWGPHLPECGFRRLRYKRRPMDLVETLTLKRYNSSPLPILTIDHVRTHCQGRHSGRGRYPT